AGGAPSPIELAVRAQRARRTARLERERQRKLARRRFAALLLLLLFFTAFLALTVWDQLQALFGL
ncbi:MAG: hypothetical protein M3327_07270, partial [Actinomycetota bacterium]|nr:hypothetical protein [Actinomycetota bacterium]